MQRIVKAPEVRRQEIIEAAQRLFDEKGYTKTSVQAIIQEAGIAKGTFYHYFKAKQDILRAIVDKIVEQIEGLFTSLVDDDSKKALEKLKEMLGGAQKQETVDQQVMEIVHLPENRELQEALNIQGVKMVAPLIHKVLVQGFHEGTFKKKPTLESIQLILAGNQFILESGLFAWDVAQRKCILAEIQGLLEHVVGAPTDTLKFIKDL